MKKFLLHFLILIITIFCSCERIFVEPKPGLDNVSIFNEYSKICIEKYGLAAVKGVNLQALSDSIRPFINNNLSQKELFDYLGLFVDRMQEGHTNLESLDGQLYKGYAWYIGFPIASRQFIANDYYYGPGANPDVQFIGDFTDVFPIKYGYLSQDTTIGYIHMQSFDLDVSNQDLERMMAYLKDADGIILDVRDNLGGFSELVARLASYFTTKEVVIGSNFIKAGPEPTNFKESIMKIQPSGSAYTYTKKVAVLHNRISFSSGSLICVAMDALPNVVRIGQTYGGGTGEIVDGFLANGWKYTISTSNLVDAQGRPTDIGVLADIEMVTNPLDTNKDVIIERAILELQ